MERCVESLLPLDLLEEMDLDVNSSPRSYSSQWSTGTSSDVSEIRRATVSDCSTNQITPTEWRNTILPMCLDRVAAFNDDRHNVRPLPGRAFVSLYDEVHIMCKLREMGVGDGFPAGELAQSYPPQRVAAINIVSEVIDSYLGREARKFAPKPVQRPKPATTFKPLRPVSDDSPGISASVSAKQKIMVYLSRSGQCIANVAEKRQTLESIFKKTFPETFTTNTLSPYPKSLLPLETIVAKVDELTSLIDFECMALELFFTKIGTLTLDTGLKFLSEATHAHWFLQMRYVNIPQLRETNSRLIRKLRNAERHVNVDQLLMIPAFSDDFIDHNRKIELLKKELEMYGNILITELSSYLEVQTTANATGCRSLSQTTA